MLMVNGFYVFQENLAAWEKMRESERRKLLVKEAELKQNQDVWASVSKHRAKLVERLMFRQALSSQYKIFINSFL